MLKLFLNFMFGLALTTSVGGLREEMRLDIVGTPNLLNYILGQGTSN
jgi:hypothetical protein